MNSDESDERSALVLRPETPVYGRFTLLLSDAYVVETTEVGRTLRLDFRRRTLHERLEVWRRKLGL